MFTISPISSSTTTILVPKESLTTYKENIYWAAYSNIIYSSTYTVTFLDWNGSVLEIQEIPYGEDSSPTATPTRDGYLFSSWDKSLTDINSDLTVTALYTQLTYAFHIY